MSKCIYIYSDEGVGDFSLYAVKNYFSAQNIKLITAQEIIKFGMPKDADVFVMPGGADRPYTQKLNGKGNDFIQRYVSEGGIYLGICAGGYYGCSAIEFQKNTSGEICEERELGFFKGTAIGCLSDIAQPYDQTLRSASITNIICEGESLPVLYWGGCYFKPENHSDFQILYCYDALESKPPSIIACKYGKGVAILSGVHFETSSQSLALYDFDSANENILKSQLAKKLNLEKNLSFDELVEKIEVL